MVRKLSAGLVSVVLVASTLLLLGSPPSAAAGTVVVQGHNLDAAHLFEFRDRCSSSTPNPPAAQALGSKSGTLGTHSIGWQFGATDFEVGALAPVYQPTTLNTIAVDVYSPSAHTRGHVVGFYYDTTPGYTAGFWVGFRSITLNGAGWGNWDINVQMFWEYYEGGVLVDWYDDPWTVAQLAGLRGGGGRTYVGAALGCDGESFFVDRMRVSDGVDQTVYDFEGVPSASGLFWYSVKKSKKKKTVKLHTENLTVLYGTRFSLLGIGVDPAAPTIYAGTGSLYEKRRGSSSFVRVQGAGFDPGHFAVFPVKPREETTYAFASDSTDWFEPSGSNAITVDVLATLKARINDRSLKPGQRAVLSGRIGPGDRGTKVSLERRVGSGWATVDTTRTRGGGAFSVSVKATKVGKMVLRLKVAPPRKGIHGALSTRVTVTVTPRPKPKPPTPSGDGGSTTHTETTETTETVSTSPAPTPDDENIRVLAKLPAQAGLVPPPAEPICTLPGPYLAPCPPVRHR